ncbi:flagellar hook-basal body complex protein FliE [Acidimangrovimonas sediminis]|uniref:flagellar hook-basal body complex protein FliE n=1 Tax=Acidimangrovimonas sediminis TaxID=2056283 RepID=UPI000C80B3DD|nr:flagellar hook-basal body complex protein FliE [Acidimangrovimonas sediminis]
MTDANSILSASFARGAYGQAKALTGGAGDMQAAQTTPGGQSFAEMLGQATADALQTTRQAEATMQAGLAGRVDTQSVVEATMALESTVKVSVAVRDKLVSAYQQIMQMQI